MSGQKTCLLLYFLCSFALFHPPFATSAEALPPDAAFALALKKAERGDVAAMLAMGGFHEHGIGTATDYTLALEWYEKAAEAGSAEGYYNTGVFYEVGLGTRTDRAKAAECFLRAAEKGLAQGMYKVSAMYAMGDALTKDEKKALSFLAKASEAGHAVAPNDLGVIYLQGLMGQKEDPGKALAMFLRAAERGNLEAAKNIGVIFRDGLGQNVNRATALKWFLIAGKRGYPPEQLAPAMEELRASMTADQIRYAETQADAWLHDSRNKRREGQGY